MRERRRFREGGEPQEAACPRAHGCVRADTLAGTGVRPAGGYTPGVEPREPAFLTLSLGPSPTIEAYKKDVDRTLLRENLRLTTTERVRKMVAALRFADAVRGSRVKTTAP
jgi:hypothetical protein